MFALFFIARQEKVIVQKKGMQILPDPMVSKKKQWRWDKRTNRANWSRSVRDVRRIQRVRVYALVPQYPVPTNSFYQLRSRYGSMMSSL